MDEKEVWSPFPEFERRYEVSNLGRYRSFRIVYIGSTRAITYKILSFGMSPKFNYLYASLRIGKKAKCTGVHIAVAKAFVPNDDPLNKIFVNHKDGNRYNNVYTNLEWCTASENQKHAYDLGLRQKPYGSKNGRVLLKEEEVWQIFHSDENQYFLAAMYGISRSTIGNIKQGKIWGHLTGKEYTPKSKIRLSKEDVMCILNSKENQDLLADRFGVSQGVVSSIKTGRTYSNITGVKFKGKREYTYYGVVNKL